MLLIPSVAICLIYFALPGHQLHASGHKLGIITITHPRIATYYVPVTLATSVASNPTACCVPITRQLLYQEL